MSEEEKSNTEEETKAALDDIDRRSIYVGNIDYSASTLELHDLFREFGTIERVTIPVDQMKRPKGYAYIEFSSHPSVLSALVVNDKTFKGRKLKVMPKRTNLPGFAKAKVRPRGRFMYQENRRNRYPRHR